MKPNWSVWRVIPKWLNVQNEKRSCIEKRVTWLNIPSFWKYSLTLIVRNILEYGRCCWNIVESLKNIAYPIVLCVLYGNLLCIFESFHHKQWISVWIKYYIFIKAVFYWNIHGISTNKLKQSSFKRCGRIFQQ